MSKAFWDGFWDGLAGGPLWHWLAHKLRVNNGSWLLKPQPRGMLLVVHRCAHCGVERDATLVQLPANR